MYRKLRFVRYSAIGLGVWGVNPWLQGTYKFANCSIFNFRAREAPVFQVFTDLDFMAVQSNWSLLTTIYFPAFMLMFLKEQSFTSYRTFARFGTMFQPEPSDCV